MKEKKSYLLIYLLLVIIPLAVYWQCTSYDFVWDDKDPNLLENRYLQNPTLENIAHFWTKPYAQMYIPMSYTAWAFIKELGTIIPFGNSENGFNPFIFHFFNVLFHILNGILVFKILHLLIKKNLPAFIGALFFVLHPLQVETVVWITEFRGLLATFFGFSSLYILIKNEALKDTNISKIHLRIRYINSIILFLFGMLSKPSVVVIPAFAFLSYIFYYKHNFLQSLKKVTPFIIITIPFIVILRFIQPASYHTEIAPLWSRFFIWMDTINFYLIKTGIPFRLVATYTRTFQNLLPHSWFYIEWIVPPLIVFFAAKTYKRHPLILLSILIFITGFLPVSGLIPFVFQKWSNVADRYMYLSMLGGALLIGWLLKRYQQKLVWFLSLCITVCLTLLTCFVQIPVWKNSLTLWSHALTYGRPNAFAYNNRGAAYNDIEQFDKAISDLNMALTLNPDNPSSYNNRGFAFSQTDQNQEALMDFDKALEYDPGYYEVYINRGNALKGKGDVESALDNYKKSLQLNPHQPKSYYNIGLTYAENNKPDSAIVYYDKAISKSPNYTAAYLNRGLAYAGMKQYDRALADYNYVLSIDPSDDMAYNNRGILFFDLGQLNKAILDFSKSIELNPERASTYYLRGKVYFLRKNYTAALEDYTKTLSSDETFESAYTKRALLYLELGNTEKALEDIHKAESIQKDDVELLTVKGDILSASKFFDAAVGVYTQAINLSPDHGELYQKRAVAYYFLEKYNLARHDIQKAQSFGAEVPSSFQKALNKHL